MRTYTGSRTSFGNRFASIMLPAFVAVACIFVPPNMDASLTRLGVRVFGALPLFSMRNYFQSNHMLHHIAQ